MRMKMVKILMIQNGDEMGLELRKRSIGRNRS